MQTLASPRRITGNKQELRYPKSVYKGAQVSNCCSIPVCRLCKQIQKINKTKTLRTGSWSLPDSITMAHMEMFDRVVFHCLVTSLYYHYKNPSSFPSTRN